jgi:hypothetical protein
MSSVGYRVQRKIREKYELKNSALKHVSLSMGPG